MNTEPVKIMNLRLGDMFSLFGIDVYSVVYLSPMTGDFYLLRAVQVGAKAPGMAMVGTFDGNSTVAKLTRYQVHSTKSKYSDAVLWCIEDAYSGDFAPFASQEDAHKSANDLNSGDKSADELGWVQQ